MEITYYGHSCFKLTGKVGSVVTDPFGEYVGLPVPKLTADLVTVSHQHPDHNVVAQVGATSRRQRPFIIDSLGEYEVGGISVFGVPTHHDATQGTERGSNFVFTILIDGIRVCHLGDVGHELSSEQVEAIGQVDVLLCPVGGGFTINPEQAVKTIGMLEPAIAIPMHFRTPSHNPQVFADLATLEDFLKEYGSSPEPTPKLSLDKTKLPLETEIVVLRS
jgi:L-ascorbate metabolism protein UlaG (beta-lactamase superfamily)